MEIRKCCNHPYLILGGREKILENIVESKESNDPLVTDPLIFTSGKMIFLYKLLKKLYPEGSKILIFSQFTTTLDIIEEFLDKCQYGYDRIDGNINGSARQNKINNFNDIDNKSKLIFLLSTKAGGQGNKASSFLILIVMLMLILRYQSSSC